MSIYSTYRFIIKQAEPRNFDFSTTQPSNQVANLVSPVNPPLSSYQNTFTSKKGPMVFDPYTNRTDTAHQYNPPADTVKNIKSIPEAQRPEALKDIRTKAKKLDLMRWLLSQGGKQQLATPVPIHEPRAETSYFDPNKKQVVFSAFPTLPTVLHEYGHNLKTLNREDTSTQTLNDLKLATGLGRDSYVENVLLPKHTVMDEMDASFKYPNPIISSMLSDDPELLSQFNNYANYLNQIALNTYKTNAQGKAVKHLLNTAEDKSKGYYQLALEEARNQNRNAVNTAIDLTENLEVYKQDEDIYGRLLNYAIRHGYDPVAGWYNADLDFNSYGPEPTMLQGN